MITLQRLYRLRFFHLRPALFAGPARIVAPELKHRLAKMIDDVFAIEVNVFDQRSAVFTIENDVLFFAWPPAPLYNQANGVWRTLGRVRGIGRNEKRFALPDNVINDVIAFTDAHLNVAFKLIEILFRINEMKIVPRIRAFNDHYKEITAVVKIPVAHRRFEFIGVFFDPFLYINWGLHSGHRHQRIAHVQCVKLP